MLIRAHGRWDRELQGFDPNFFNEIETLKYRAAETQNQFRAAEANVRTLQVTVTLYITRLFGELPIPLYSYPFWALRSLALCSLAFLPCDMSSLFFCCRHVCARWNARRRSCWNRRSLAAAAGNPSRRSSSGCSRGYQMSANDRSACTDAYVAPAAVHHLTVPDL